MNRVAPSLVVLVDGSNVQHCDAWRRQHQPGDHSIIALAAAVTGWAHVSGVEVVLAFDGSVPDALLASIPDVEVVATGSEEADHLLARRAAVLADAGTRYRLVSSDNAVRLVAGASAEHVSDADAFVEELLEARSSIEIDAAQRDVHGTSDARSRIADAASDGVRSQLERMRRGL